MLEMLKKLGIPATIAAVVSALITIVPFLFKIDERYAKTEELNTKIDIVSKQINELSVEVGHVAGTQQVLVSLMSNRTPSPDLIKSQVEPDGNQPDVKAIVPPEVSPILQGTSELKIISKSLALTQSRLREIQQLTPDSQTGDKK